MGHTTQTVASHIEILASLMPLGMPGLEVSPTQTSIGPLTLLSEAIPRNIRMSFAPALRCPALGSVPGQPPSLKRECCVPLPFHQEKGSGYIHGSVKSDSAMGLSFRPRGGSIGYEMVPPQPHRHWGIIRFSGLAFSLVSRLLVWFLFVDSYSCVRAALLGFAREKSNCII